MSQTTDITWYIMWILFTLGFLYIVKLDKRHPMHKALFERGKKNDRRGKKK